MVWGTNGNLFPKRRNSLILSAVSFTERIVVMRRIVCFGDSNTYGQSPVDGSRYGEGVRWPGVLDNLLGDGFEVVNEGKNGRTIAFDDPYIEGCNGLKDIGSCLERNDPVDLLIIMLGTNDLKVYFESTPQMIADNLRNMCELVRERTDAKLLLVSPMLLGDQIEFSPLHLEFGREQVDYSFELAPQIEKVAEETGSEFIDLAVVAMSSDVDCLHLMPEEHAKVAQAMQEKVLSVFKEELEQEAREREEERRRQEEEERKRKEEEAARKLAEQQEEEARRQEEEAKRQEEAAKELAEQQEEEARRQEEAARQFVEQQEEEAEHYEAESLFGQPAASMGLTEDVHGAVGDQLLDQIEEIERKAQEILGSGGQGPGGEITEESPSEEGAIQFQALVREVVGEKSSKDETAQTIQPNFGTVAASQEEVSEVNMAAAVSNEQENMSAGRLYRRDAGLNGQRERVKASVREYNGADQDRDTRQRILTSLFGRMGRNCAVEPPFSCDYGFHISVGDDFYAYEDCFLQDAGKIKIGNRVFLGPRVSIYTAGYPIYAPVRNEFLEYASEVTIGDDVWIGGSVTINPGVHIGNNVVIGAGSVVTADIPDGVVAAGNPCRIMRRISDSDKKLWEQWKAERE